MATTTRGGVMFGDCATGSRLYAIKPVSTMMTMMTEAKTGRWMKSSP
jgi:hypothetical protein